MKKIERHDVKDGDLTYTIQKERMIIAEHNKCFRKQAASTATPLQSFTYCHCSVEFNKRFYIAALGADVAVELVHTIIMGARSCKFIITMPYGETGV